MCSCFLIILFIYIKKDLVGDVLSWIKNYAIKINKKNGKIT
jgi:hypothetical protein